MDAERHSLHFPIKRAPVSGAKVPPWRRRGWRQRSRSWRQPPKETPTKPCCTNGTNSKFCDISFVINVEEEIEEEEEEEEEKEEEEGKRRRRK